MTHRLIYNIFSEAFISCMPFLENAANFNLPLNTSSVLKEVHRI